MNCKFFVTMTLLLCHSKFDSFEKSYLFEKLFKLKLSYFACLTTSLVGTMDGLTSNYSYRFATLLIFSNLEESVENEETTLHSLTSVCLHVIKSIKRRPIFAVSGAIEQPPTGPCTWNIASFIAIVWIKFPLWKIERIIELNSEDC